jgi:hypothetical protein
MLAINPLSSDIFLRVAFVSTLRMEWTLMGFMRCLRTSSLNEERGRVRAALHVKDTAVSDVAAHSLVESLRICAFDPRAGCPAYTRRTIHS